MSLLYYVVHDVLIMEDLYEVLINLIESVIDDALDVTLLAANCVQKLFILCSYCIGCVINCYSSFL